MRVLQICSNHIGRGPTPFHKDAGAGASTERLDAHRPRPGKEIEDVSFLDDSSENGKNGLAHLVGGGTCLHSPGHAQVMALDTAGDYSHIRVWGINNGSR